MAAHSTRRSTRSVVIALTIGTLAAGCGGGGSGGSGGGDDGDGALRYGIEMGINLTAGTLDPAQSLKACDSIVYEFIYDTLTRLDENGEAQPLLADSWTIDGTVFTLTLKPGLQFSDGSPFDAAAVKKGIEYLKTGQQTKDELATVESIEVVDDVTLEITSSNEAATNKLPRLFSGREGMIPSPASIDDQTVGSDPIGAGPYVFDSQRPGSEIVLKKNKSYKGPRDLQIPGITFTQVGVGGPAVNALKAGQLDLITFQAESLGEVEGDAKLGNGSRLTDAYYQLQFRLAPPLDKLEVRQAINYALDRDALNQQVGGGLGEVAWQPTRKGQPGHNDTLDEVYAYDPQKAKDLLAQAGLADGVDLEVVIPGGGIVNMERQGELIQQQLGEVGIRVKLTRSTQIADEYYLGGIGNAFSAQRLPGSDPTSQFNDQWGKAQFVAIWNFQERDDITQLVFDARKSGDPAVVDQKIQEAAKVVVDNALEAPIAFATMNIAWSKERVEGEPGAPRGTCDPIILDGVTLK